MTSELGYGVPGWRSWQDPVRSIVQYPVRSCQDLVCMGSWQELVRSISCEVFPRSCLWELGKNLGKILPRCSTWSCLTHTLILHCFYLFLNFGLVSCFRDESIAVEAGTFSQLQEIQVEVLPADEGETFVESQGGKVGVGDDYASNFVVIRPEEMPAKDGKKLKIKMKVDDGAKTSTIELFRGSPSENLVTWYKVEAEINEGYATFETEKGEALTFFWKPPPIHSPPPPHLHTHTPRLRPLS